MKRCKAVQVADLLYRIENIENFFDEVCNLTNNQEDKELISILNKTQTQVIEYKKRLEDELEKL